MYETSENPKDLGWAHLCVCMVGSYGSLSTCLSVTRSKMTRPKFSTLLHNRQIVLEQNSVAVFICTESPRFSLLMAIANSNFGVKSVSHVTGRCALLNVKLHFFFQCFRNFLWIWKPQRLIFSHWNQVRLTDFRFVNSSFHYISMKVNIFDAETCWYMDYLKFCSGCVDSFFRQLALYSTDDGSRQGFFFHVGGEKNKNKISWPAVVGG